jgi:hypothetical protein
MLTLTPRSGRNFTRTTHDCGPQSIHTAGCELKWLNNSARASRCEFFWDYNVNISSDKLFEILQDFETGHEALLAAPQADWARR